MTLATNSATNVASIFDVAVVGGGPAGAATALCLAAAGRSVILIERSGSPGLRAGEMLAPEICPVLRQLGVWDSFLASKPSPAHGIWSAWGEPRLAARDFIANPYGPGWRIDRACFDQMLRAASQQAGARVEAGFDRVDVFHNGQGWKIDAHRAGQRLSFESRFVVDASGRAAAVARKSGAQWRGRDRLVAFIGVLAPSGVFVAGEDVLLIESVSNGWWYSSVLPGGELVAAFLTDADLASDRSQKPIERWQEALTFSEFTRARAAGFVPSAFYTRPARTGCLDRAAGADWISVGDAASAIDPLSGIGIAKGLRGAILAANAVDQGLAGHRGALESYDHRVRNDFEAAQRTGGAYYGAERRWPESPFWRRRHGSANYH